MANEAYNLQGQNGGFFLSGSGSVNTFSKADNNGRPGSGFEVIEDAVLAVYVGNISNAQEDLPGRTLTAGLYFPGQVDSLDVTSGSVVVLK